MFKHYTNINNENLLTIDDEDSLILMTNCKNISQCEIINCEHLIMFNCSIDSLDVQAITIELKHVNINHVTLNTDMGCVSTNNCTIKTFTNYANIWSTSHDNIDKVINMNKEVRIEQDTIKDKNVDDVKIKIISFNRYGNDINVRNADIVVLTNITNTENINVICNSLIMKECGNIKNVRINAINSSILNVDSDKAYVKNDLSCNVIFSKFNKLSINTKSLYLDYNEIKYVNDMGNSTLLLRDDVMGMNTNDIENSNNDEILDL